jgi:RNA polymerase sigma-70 factor (sigma-E family)
VSIGAGSGTGNGSRLFPVSTLARVRPQQVGSSLDDAEAGVVERTLSRLRRLDAESSARGIDADLATRGLGAPAAPAPRSGRPKTLADLYAEHRLRLVRLATLLVDEPGTAEDVVQEAFAGLHRNWTGLRDEHAALGYLRIAVVNGSRSVLRRRRTAREYVPPHQVNARSAESLAMLSAEHQAVVDALGKLPPRQREVLVLRYYGGLSEAEIAEATGISRGAVKSTASRALDSVGRWMQRGGGGLR